MTTRRDQTSGVKITDSKGETQPRTTVCDAKLSEDISNGLRKDHRSAETRSLEATGSEVGGSTAERG